MISCSGHDDFHTMSAETSLWCSPVCCPSSLLLIYMLQGHHIPIPRMLMEEDELISLWNAKKALIF